MKCITQSGISGAPTLTVAFNGQSQTESGFLVVAVTGEVVSVDKTSISAVQKQDIIITVNEAPSTDINDYEGILESPLSFILMKVNSITPNGSNFDFNVRFPGAPRGEEFTIYLAYNYERYASTHLLSTETTLSDITLTGGSGTTVSKNGGNQLTLTGTAFSTDIDDLVVVVGSSKATIVSSTGTEIVVRVPSTDTLGETELGVYQKPNIEVP